MKQILTALSFFLLVCSWPAQAVLDVEITQGTEDALPIAIVPFNWTGAPVAAGAETQPDMKWAEVISSDLLRSGRFAPVAEKDLLNRPQSAENLDF